MELRYPARLVVSSIYKIPGDHHVYIRDAAGRLDNIAPDTFDLTHGSYLDEIPSLTAYADEFLLLSETEWRYADDPTRTFPIVKEGLVLHLMGSDDKPVAILSIDNAGLSRHQLKVVTISRSASTYSIHHAIDDFAPGISWDDLVDRYRFDSLGARSFLVQYDPIM